jgi:hypothetical protein
MGCYQVMLSISLVAVDLCAPVMKRATWNCRRWILSKFVFGVVDQKKKKKKKKKEEEEAKEEEEEKEEEQ